MPRSPYPASTQQIRRRVRRQRILAVEETTRPTSPFTSPTNSILAEVVEQLEIDKPTMSPQPTPPPSPNLSMSPAGRHNRMGQPSPTIPGQTIANAIISLITTGTTPSVAAESNGICYGTLKNWKAQGKAAAAILDDYESVHDDTPDPSKLLDRRQQEYYNFYIAVTAARAQFLAVLTEPVNRVAREGRKIVEYRFERIEVKDKDGNIIDIKTKRYKHSEKYDQDGMMALKLLERRAPDEFATTRQLQLTGKDGGAIEIDVEPKVDVTNIPLGNLSNDPKENALLQEKYLDAYDKYVANKAEEERRKHEKVVNVVNTEDE